MSEFLISIGFGLIGLAITKFAFGLKLELPGAIAGGIGVAIYVAIEAAKRRGTLEAGFQLHLNETDDG